MRHTIFQWISILGTAANTVSIWICIKTYMKHSKRMDKLDLELTQLKMEFEIRMLGKLFGKGTARMVEETKMAGSKLN
jgi:hypothetical protein